MSTWICPKCTDEEGMPLEFSLEEEYKKHNKLHEQNKIEPPPKPPKVPLSKAKPIELTYVYTGVCSNCKTPVETIPLDTEKKTKVVVIAWCLSCREKRAQREVAKL